ncbi:hypothetical protein MTO96_031443 [Rhipicephalus appendiculatus]
MKNQVVVIFAILCFTSAAVNANADVDHVIEQLKSLVRDFVTDKDKAQEYLSKIESASQCLSAAKDINPEIIKKMAKSAIPTIMECGSQFIILKDPQERANKIKDCLVEKANNFKQSSGMTPEEMKMFDDASFLLIQQPSRLAVDLIIDRLKSLVRQLVPNEAIAQQLMDRIDSTRECLLMARDINPAIIQRFTDGIVPTATECAARTIGISDRTDRANAASSGMTPDEMTMFDNAGLETVASENANFCGDNHFVGGAFGSVVYGRHIREGAQNYECIRPGRSAERSVRYRHLPRRLNRPGISGGVGSFIRPQQLTLEAYNAFKQAVGNVHNVVLVELLSRFSPQPQLFQVRLYLPESTEDALDVFLPDHSPSDDASAALLVVLHGDASNHGLATSAALHLVLAAEGQVMLQLRQFSGESAVFALRDAMNVELLQVGLPEAQRNDFGVHENPAIEGDTSLL